MRILYLLVLLAVAIVAVAFTAQNDVEVAVKFFGLSASGSLSLVLVVTLSIGIILGLLIMAPSVFKRALSASGLKRRLAKVEKDSARLKEQAAPEAAEGESVASASGQEAPGAQPTGMDAAEAGRTGASPETKAPPKKTKGRSAK